MTQEELNELASDCRLAFGHQAGAYNDGVDAMLRAVSIAQAQAAVEPVGKVLEVAADGSFQTGFFEELPVGTLLYTSPPDDLKFRPDWSGVDVLGEELHEAQKAMRLALKALQGVLKANRITQSRGLPDTYAEADRIRSQIISAVSVAEAAIAALEGALK